MQPLPASTSSDAGPWFRKHRILLTVAVALAGVAVVALVLLATIPVPQTYTFADNFQFLGSVPLSVNIYLNESLCPAGANASVFFASSGLTATFSVTAPNGTHLWSGPSPDANTTFIVPACGGYELAAVGSGNGVLNVSGTVSFTAPLL